MASKTAVSGSRITEARTLQALVDALDVTTAYELLRALAGALDVAAEAHARAGDEGPSERARGRLREQAVRFDKARRAILAAADLVADAAEHEPPGTDAIGDTALACCIAAQEQGR